MIRNVISLVTSLMLAGVAHAQDMVSFTVEEGIEDVLFSVENEIIGRGLKIDSVSHVGAMLDRTGLDLGATEKIFYMAEVFSFCSATTSREVMEVNPANIAYCPYTIFVYTTPDAMDKTTVGHSAYPEGEMQIVQELLTGIVKDALMID